ncbi:Site-specific recombinase XerD [Massilia sp. LC238]|nr:Site-specific recombinase XerD [Massilia sp. LC238]
MFSSVSVSRQVYNDSSGSFYEVPVLHTETGYFDSLLDYCLEKRGKSTVWMRKLVHSVQLLLEYVYVNPHEQNNEQLFKNFASKLQTGTFNPQTGHDPSRLGWRPRTPYDVQQIITRLSDFLDWLSQRDSSVIVANPRVRMSATDKAIRGCAETYRRRYTLLGHIWKPPTDTEQTTRAVGGSSGPRVTGEPPAFPDERFEELLERGFTIGGRTNYRDQAITLLMHGGGFRVSEPMHIYIGDVTRDPSNYLRAHVRIHHPSLGEAPGDLLDERGRPIRCGRAEYLQRKYGLAPRIDLMSKREAGWKGVALDGKYYLVPFWFKPDYAELFMQIWEKYMEEVADIPLNQRRHPYAFMNLRREPKGSIYALDKFITSHGRACERIGLQVAKHLGTTPHGHRHSYGRRLAAAGIPHNLIKKCMHHATEQSQEVYTTSTTQEALVALEAGFQRMRFNTGISK